MCGSELLSLHIPIVQPVVVMHLSMYIPSIPPPGLPKVRLGDLTSPSSNAFI